MHFRTPQVAGMQLLPYHPYRTANSGRACEAPVAGEQCRSEVFGEGDVGRIVSGHVVPERPYPGQVRPVIVALDWKHAEALYSALSVVGAVQAPIQYIPTQLLGYFEVKQRGPCKFTRLSDFVRMLSLWIEDQLVDHAGVHDCHRFSATPYLA